MAHDPRYRQWVNCACYNRKCSNYQCRYRLRKKPHLYVQAKRAACPGCGRRLSISSFRDSGRETKHYRCVCGGRPWQHRRGSPCCVHSRAHAAGFDYEQIGTPEYEQWRLAGRPVPEHGSTAARQRPISHDPAVDGEF